MPDTSPDGRREVPFVPKEASEAAERSRSRLAEAGLALLLCMTMDKPKPKTKDELEKEAEKKLPKDIVDDKVRNLYVKDRLSVQSPGDFPALTEDERFDLIKGMHLVASASWKGKAKPFELKDEAMLNVLRSYPTMPDEIRDLAEQRELARLNKQKPREALGLEDNATLDAWLRRPKGTDKELKADAKKFAKWAKINGGADLPEKPEERAERKYPGAPADVQKLAIEKEKKGTLGDEDERLLAAWTKVPYSDKWRSDEWLASASPAMSAWKSPPAPDPAKFYDTVRKAMCEKNPSDESRVILDAYDRFSNNPRAWELYVRSRIATKEDVGDWKKFTEDDQKELADWTKFKDVYRGYAARGRELETELRPIQKELKSIAKELVPIREKLRSGKLAADEEARLREEEARLLKEQARLQKEDAQRRAELRILMGYRNNG